MRLFKYVRHALIIHSRIFGDFKSRCNSGLLRLCVRVCASVRVCLRVKQACIKYIQEYSETLNHDAIAAD